MVGGGLSLRGGDVLVPSAPRRLLVSELGRYDVGKNSIRMVETERKTTDPITPFRRLSLVMYIYRERYNRYVGLYRGMIGEGEKI